MPYLHSIFEHIHKHTRTHTRVHGIYIHHHIHLGFSTHANTSICRLLMKVQHTYRDREKGGGGRRNVENTILSQHVAWHCYKRMPRICFQIEILT